MPSQARRAFDENCQDVDRLLEIHKTLTGDTPGRRYQVEVLNKSAIVLVTAFWEAYCEDIAAEALAHLVEHAETADKLPEALRKTVAKELKETQHELAIWTLADDGWRVALQTRLARLRENRNWRFNAPKSANVDALFSDALGIPSISTSWYWSRMPADATRKKLDGYVELRGAVAHRGKASASVRKKQVEDYYKHIRRLVARTGGQVANAVHRATGKRLWE